MTRTLVLHPALRGSEPEIAERALDESKSLTRALALDLVQSHIVWLAQHHAGTLLGQGKVAEIAAEIAQEEIALVVIDGTVSPVQQRNLERAWNAKVLDRTGLILEIFGARAQTREGVLQVDLAHLSYQKSRLVRSWTHLERQRGGTGFMGGPGERQIESDRRILDEKITRLRRQLAKVKRTRTLHRAARKRVPYPIVALVGYTNAGKSTLFNRLTSANVLAEDMLFATLDPTMRQIVLPSGRMAILSDTVGFISALPTQLVAAFRATLEEVSEADLIVHVRDISHPQSLKQAQEVDAVLADLGVGEMLRGSILQVLNKVDLLDPQEHATIHNTATRQDEMIPLSATTGHGCDALLAAIETRLFPSRQVMAITLGHQDGAAVAWLHRHGEIHARSDDENGTRLSVALTAREYAQFSKTYPHLI